MEILGYYFEKEEAEKLFAQCKMAWELEEFKEEYEDYEEFEELFFFRKICVED